MSARTQPLAIVGIGCRFPGGITDPATFWRVIAAGTDCVTDIPPDRRELAGWYDPRPATPGRMTTRRGGFLPQVDHFDAAFFGIAPREAIRLDPQQRLLLETAWETFEDAGTDVRTLEGSRTGVFVGEWLSDYETMMFAHPAELDFFSAQGTGRYAASGRISFAFGLRGPALTVDTACSSSLVAVHLACRSLLDGECDQAIAAGVNVILQPNISIAYSQSRMMAPDGRCKFGDAHGDGYIRSEGVAAILLKPLDRALADGDRIHALIRGSAIGNDGRTSGSLGTPSRAGQEDTLRAAYSDAGIAPARVAYVEAHGTGTRAGDPVELGALGAVLCEGPARTARCFVGSVKTNLGHTEGAAGLAGLIKAALVLRFGAVPPSLHCEVLNPAIPWSELPLEIPQRLIPLPSDGRKRIAGVSSMGIAGTNAHVVLEEAPLALPVVRSLLPRAFLLPLSARSHSALAELANAYATLLESPDAPALADVCASAAWYRTPLRHRAAFVSETPADMVDRLRRFSQGDASGAQASGVAMDERPRRLAFVFPGQGAQWEGMARELLVREPAFRASLERSEAALRPLVDWSLLEQLQAGTRFDDIAVVQPVLLAVEIALANLWRAYGVEPAAVVGHSMGEAAAACVAGALTLEEAMAIVCRRSALMRRTSGQGAMAMVELPLEEATSHLDPFGERLSVAVNNGARSTIVAGEPEALQELLASLDGEGVFCRLVKVDVASHSPQMDPLVPELVTSLAALRPTHASIPLYSTVTAERVEGGTLEAAYWGRNLRATVRFRETVVAMQGDGIEGFIEMSPHPLLVPALQPAMALPSLRREEPEQASLLSSLGALFVIGHPIEWRRLYADGHARVDLPHYPWQRERFWWEPSGGVAGAPDATGRENRHPFLARAFRQADGRAAHWETLLGPAQFTWLADHRVGGSAVFPAAAFCEAALAAAREARPDTKWALRDVHFHAPLALGEAATRVQVGVDWRTGDDARFTMHASAIEDVREDAWTLHASGELIPASRMAAATMAGDTRPAAGAPRLGADELKAAFAGVALEYGPAFRALQGLRVDGRSGVGDISLDAESLDVSASSYASYPPLLDAALQALVALLTRNALAEGETILPASIGRLVVHEPIPLHEPLTVHASLQEITEQAAHGAFRLLASDGRLVAEAADVTLARVRLADATPLAQLLYDATWRPTELANGAAPSRALLLTPDAETAGSLEAALRAVGIDTSVCTATEAEAMGRAVGDFLNGGAGENARSAIVHLLALDAPPPDEGAAWSEASWRLAGDSVLALVRAIDAAGSAARPRVWFVSRRAVSVLPTDGAMALGQSALWGLGRVVAHEYPALEATLVDLDSAGVGVLAPLLCSQSVERQVALRDGRWHALRLVPRGPIPPVARPAGSAQYAASTSHPGVVEQLHWQQVDVGAPAPDEVEIEVAATGLNFMNLLSALGMCPGWEHGLGPLGIECAGRVRRVGDAVTTWAPGNAVVAVAPGCLGSRTVAHQALVARMPPGLAPEDAAALPIVFLTAWYGLHHLARLAQGERVLIHSAAGGVGLAALQVARHLGAEVLATAGSEEKRALVRSLGAVAVFDSRSTSFADDVLQVTGGLGVDVVLNSLAGDAIEAGLRTLAPYGRFVELGKRDIYGTTAIGLQPFRRNLSYFAMDLDRMMRERPVALGRHLRDVMQRVEAGDFTPLPTRTFAADDLVEAFRLLMPGTHVGKHVVSHVNRPSSIAVPVRQRFPVAEDGTYIITGGLGGLGLEVAGWLARRGAGCLVLLGRGAPSAEGQAAIAAFERQGTRVLVVACDVAEQAELEALLERVRTACPPLRGVFHAAGILQDAPLISLTPATLRATGRAKVLGAWHLDRLTEADPLDAFVLFSSVASLFGTPGQGNYAAANAFLDALAHHRRARGRPALSVNFGPVRNVGLAAASALRGNSLSRLGFDGLAPSRVVDALDALLGADATHAACMHLDPARWYAATGERAGRRPSGRAARRRTFYAAPGQRRGAACRTAAGSTRGPAPSRAPGRCGEGRGGCGAPPSGSARAGGPGPEGPGAGFADGARAAASARTEDGGSPYTVARVELPDGSRPRRSPGGATRDPPRGRHACGPRGNRRRRADGAADRARTAE